MNEPGQKPGWHVDKTVPITLIFALAAQFFVGMWFVSKLDARIYALEVAQVTQTKRDDGQDSAYNASLSLLREDMRDIARKLDRLIEARAK